MEQSLIDILSVRYDSERYIDRDLRDAVHRSYREDLKEFRNNGWSLVGLAQTLRIQGKPSAAPKAEQDFERAWKNADVTLKQPCSNVPVFMQKSGLPFLRLSAIR